MNRNAVAVGIYLVFIFTLSMAGHLLYVEGWLFDKSKPKSQHQKPYVSVFSDEASCIEETGGPCKYQQCDEIPKGKEFEDVCGEGFKKGWISEQHKDEH